jgi:hypothetical protein
MRNAKFEIRNEELGLRGGRSRALKIQSGNFAIRISQFAFLVPAQAAANQQITEIEAQLRK